MTSDLVSKPEWVRTLHLPEIPRIHVWVQNLLTFWPPYFCQAEAGLAPVQAALRSLDWAINASCVVDFLPCWVWTWSSVLPPLWYWTTWLQEGLLETLTLLSLDMVLSASTTLCWTTWLQVVRLLPCWVWTWSSVLPPLWCWTTWLQVERLLPCWVWTWSSVLPPLWCWTT